MQLAFEYITQSILWMCLLWEFYLLAEKLSLLFLLCIFFYSAVHICVLNVRIVHQIPHGRWLSNSLEGNETLPCICYTHAILFYIPVVCWRPYRISFISHWYQPGQFHEVGFYLFCLSFFKTKLFSLVGCFFGERSCFE